MTAIEHVCYSGHIRSICVMSAISEPTLVLQYLVTTLSSAFNAVYFMGYRSPVGRRRIGALALALISLALMGESLYLALSWTHGVNGVPAFAPTYWLAAGLLACLGSLLITALILRRLMGGNNG